jgi:hypothetical protein
MMLHDHHARTFAKSHQSARSRNMCSLEMPWAFKCTCACECQWTSCPHWGDAVEDVIHECTHRLLFFRESFLA